MSEGSAALKTAAEEAVESQRFHGIIAFVDADKRLQFRMFTEGFPHADMAKVSEELQKFSLKEIGWRSSQATL
jgi:hypothetical protein